MQRITTLDANMDLEKNVKLEVTWRDWTLPERAAVDRIELYIGGKGDDDISLNLTATEAELIGEALMRAARLDRQAEEAGFAATLEGLVTDDTSGEESEGADGVSSN